MNFKKKQQKVLFLWFLMMNILGIHVGFWGGGWSEKWRFQLANLFFQPET